MLQIDTLPPYTQQIKDTSLAQDSSTVVSTDSTGMPTAICAYDTLFLLKEAYEPRLHQSLFTHHQLQVKNSREKTIAHEETSGWYLGGIVLSILFIILYIRNKQINIVSLLQSAIDHRALDRMQRESNLTHLSTMAPIAPIMLMPLTLVGYNIWGVQSSNLLIVLQNYLLLLMACIVIYFIRNGIIKFFGNAFGNGESIYVYVSNNYVFHLLYAIVGAAMAFFVCYTGNAGKTFLSIMVGILGVLFTIRLLRGMQIILTLSKNSKFYLFYYLCILEIVPLIAVIKLAISY